jgi:hypothetical protein
MPGETAETLPLEVPANDELETEPVPPDAAKEAPGVIQAIAHYFALSYAFNIRFIHPYQYLSI